MSAESLSMTAARTAVYHFLFRPVLQIYLFSFFLFGKLQIITHMHTYLRMGRVHDR
jgi:hypothetical protein